MRCASDTGESIFCSKFIILLTADTNPFSKLVTSTGCRIRLTVSYSTKYQTLFVILGQNNSINFFTQAAQAPVPVTDLSLLALVRPRRDTSAVS